MDYYKKYLKYKRKYLSLKLGGSSKCIFDNVDKLELLKLDNKQVDKWKQKIETLLFDSFENNIPVDTLIVSTWYLLVEGENIIGCVLLNSDNIIWNLATLEDCRGRGVATRLIKHLIEDNQNNLYLWINLTKSQKIQDKLVNFYSKFNFKNELNPFKFFTYKITGFNKQLMVRKKN